MGIIRLLLCEEDVAARIAAFRAEGRNVPEIAERLLTEELERRFPGQDLERVRKQEAETIERARSRLIGYLEGTRAWNEHFMQATFSLP